MKIIGYIRTAWLLVGMTIVFFVGIELVSICMLGLYHWTTSGRATDKRVFADGYLNMTWVSEYYRELNYYYRDRWSPYVYWRGVAYNGKYINIDDEGQRLTWNERKPGLRTINIFMFGGSAMWGTGARDDFTIPSILSSLLSKKLKTVNIKVTNFGQGGYVSTQEMITFFLQLQHGKRPDIVIFYDGINDTASAFQNLEAGIPLNELNRRREFNLLNKVREKDLLKEFALTLFENSNFGHIVLHFVRDRSLGSPWYLASQPSSGTLSSDVVNSYTFNVKLLEKICRFYGSNPLAYWQPVLFTKKFQTNYERGWENTQTAKGFYLNVYRQVDNSNGLSGLRYFHNISHIFDEDRDPIFVDFMHITEDGNRKVAEAMFPDVLKLLYKRGIR